LIKKIIINAIKLQRLRKESIRLANVQA
jgi:hypothetical protein